MAICRLKRVAADNKNDIRDQLPAVPTQKNGKRIALDVKKGDTVLFGKYAGTEVAVDGKDYLIMKESELLAKVK